jgi:hypothetical protein
MTIFACDGRLEFSLAQAKTTQITPCGCRWLLLKRAGSQFVVAEPGEDAPYAQIVSVCLLHRRWLQALFQDAQRGPDMAHGPLPFIGPVYQTARIEGEITRVETAAAPMQQGGVHQMVGPLHQPATTPEDPMSDCVEHVIGKSVKPVENLKDLLGYDPRLGR